MAQREKVRARIATLEKKIQDTTESRDALARIGDDEAVKALAPLLKLYERDLAGCRDLLAHEERGAGREPS